MAAAAPALASETPRYEPTPAWVTPAPAPTATTASSPVMEIIDQQTRIADGTVWTYNEAALRALSADALARIGTISLAWQPFHGDIIIHRVDILRDGQRIDVLKAGQKFTVIRREQKLEQLEMDGRLTATLQVEGLRVGDVLEWAYSATTKDPALMGNVQGGALAPTEPFKIGFARARFLWPDGTNIKWKAYPTGIVSTETDKAGWHELTFKLPAPKPAELPADAPPRFHRLPLIEVSSFGSWEDVSRTTAALYSTKGLIAPGSPLEQEVARIKAATSDPEHRAAAALTAVQDRIRYFANGMNGGNYVPQSPAQTWSAGYGDCKAKTLLLLAMLDALDVKAEPVLASIGTGDFVATRLPAMAAFNHIFVHARIGDKELWMDGTGRGSRMEDLQDPPPFRFVLPVRAAGAALIELPSKAPARPSRIVTVDIDESAGIGLPATFNGTVVVRGAVADSLRALTAQFDKEQMQNFALGTLSGAAGPNAMPVSAKIAFDADAGTATINVSGISGLAWQRQDHRYRYRPASSISGLSLNSDRARAAWKDIPISTGSASNSLITTRIKLPDGGKKMTLDGDPKLTLEMPARKLERTSTLSGDTLTIVESAQATGAEILPADLPAVRAKLSGAQNRIARLVTTTDYPAAFAQADAARRDRKLALLEQYFTTRITDKPEEVNRYLNRAAFYEESFQWKNAMADLDHAIAIDASANNLLRRANLLERLNEKSKAAADYKAVLALEPESKRALARLGILKVDTGQFATALEGIEPHIADAGEDKPDWLSIKAEVLAREGHADTALAALDEAVEAKPGNPTLLNGRCWTKGRLNVQLESALQDCTRAIELSSQSANNALDSRALVYLRLNRLPEALADVNAALDMRPSAPGSLFLRAVIERRSGDAHAAEADLQGAKLIAPNIVEEYAHWKIAP